MSLSAMKQALEVLSVHPEHGGNAFTRAADELRRAIDLQEKRHICPDWDFMEITVNDEEFNACCCFPKEPRPSLWLATAHDGRVKYTTDSGRASDWKESRSYRMVQDYYTELPHDFANVTDDALIEEVRRRGFTIRDAQISPKREWVWLTDTEIDEIMRPLTQNQPFSWRAFGHAIARRLKEQNYD
jgi:frataxin-like iron-binding protein CyaY